MQEHLDCECPQTKQMKQLARIKKFVGEGMNQQAATARVEQSTSEQETQRELGILTQLFPDEVGAFLSVLLLECVKNVSLWCHCVCDPQLQHVHNPESSCWRP